MLPKEKRGIATSLVAGIGLTGAVVAFFFKQMFDWRTCYFIGGGLGFLLLLLRVSVYESGMFHAVKKDSSIKKGNFFMLFTKWERTKRYLLGIFIGLPTWYVIGVLITFSNDFGKAFNIKEPIDSGKAVMFAYAAISIGDVLIGFISQWLKSRKKALYIFYFFTAVFITLFFTALQNGSAASLYIICAGMGFGTGFWAIFVTMGAEQFGTNIRATAATTIPNMVRGLLAIFILPMFKFFRAETSFVTGAIITGVVVMIVAIVSSIYIKETFGKDLNYVEE
jgi:MFS family permease